MAGVVGRPYAGPRVFSGDAGLRSKYAMASALEKLLAKAKGENVVEAWKRRLQTDPQGELKWN